MSDKTRERSETQGAQAPQHAVTVLDPVRPAVVRRRVVETSTLDAARPAPRTFISTTEPPAGFAAFDAGGAGFDDGDEDEEDEQGPPSSVNVARALASLRADELRRLDELVAADDATYGDGDGPRSAMPRSVHVPPAPARPTITAGKTITVTELAKPMGMSSKELAANLVAQGFYSVTTSTALSRETARGIAQSFGWDLVDAPDPPPEAAKPAKKSAAGKKPAAASGKPAAAGGKPKAKPKKA